MWGAEGGAFGAAENGTLVNFRASFTSELQAQFALSFDSATCYSRRIHERDAFDYFINCEPIPLKRLFSNILHFLLQPRSTSPALPERNPLHLNFHTPYHTEDGRR